MRCLAEDRVYFTPTQHWLADIVGCKELFPAAYLNQGRACSAADEAISSADTDFDQDSRIGHIAQIEDDLFGAAGEMPVIPLYYWARPIAVQSWLDIGEAEGGPLRFDRWLVDPAQLP